MKTNIFVLISVVRLCRCACAHERQIMNFLCRITCENWVPRLFEKVIQSQYKPIYIWLHFLFYYTMHYMIACLTSSRYARYSHIPDKEPFGYDRCIACNFLKVNTVCVMHLQDVTTAVWTHLKLNYCSGKTTIHKYGKTVCNSSHEYRHLRVRV